MTDYLLDTNVIIEILRNNSRVMAHMQAVISTGGDVRINALSYYETRRGLLNIRVADKLQRFDDFCTAFDIVYLDRPALDQASGIYASLRSKGTLIEDADILIAAMAIANNAVLVTDNLKHFRGVSGLQLENWVRQ